MTQKDKKASPPKRLYLILSACGAYRIVRNLKKVRNIKQNSYCCSGGNCPLRLFVYKKDKPLSKWYDH